MDYVFKGTGLTKREKKAGKKLFKQYRDKYDFENISDLTLLEQIIFKEIIIDKYKKEIEKINNNKELIDKGITPDKWIKKVDDLLESIIRIKEKLGLFKREDKKDSINWFKRWGKKALKYEEEHLEEFSVDCPFCSEKFFLHRKTNNYFPSKLKLFKNKILCNIDLWKVYKKGKINKEDMANILCTSPDYIDWVEEHIEGYNNILDT